MTKVIIIDHDHVYVLPAVAHVKRAALMAGECYDKYEVDSPIGKKMRKALIEVEIQKLNADLQQIEL